MDVLRTPDERFQGLDGYNFKPNYVEVLKMRMHYVEEGPRNAAPVLMLHGEPSWCYLYRKMIPIITAAEHRAVAPDLFGFGRSDKPTKREAYTHQMHVDSIAAFIDRLDLRDITLVGQDWGGLIGLRVAAAHPDRFARIVAANTFLPAGEGAPNDAFYRWRDFSQAVTEFKAGAVVQMGTATELPDAVVAAYDAPFPDETYVAGARQFPLIVPTDSNHPGVAENRHTWDVLRRWEKPFLTAYSDGDEIMAGVDRLFQSAVPGANGQPHTIITGAGHFLQEDRGEELARVVVDFIARTNVVSA
jgi:haloalkane dehalogenase